MQLHSSFHNLPRELLNKILVYKAELDNDLLTMQYDPMTNKEFCKINYYSEYLQDIKHAQVKKMLFATYWGYITN